MAGLKSAMQIGPSGPRVGRTGAGVTTAAPAAKDGEKKKRPSLDVVWREARELVWAHRGRLGLGFLLMLINRLAGLVLPASSKWLIDEVVDKSRGDLLVPIALAAGAATLVQAATAFALSQMLGVAAQRAITDMRKRVQAHVVRLPVRYFDSTKTGVLISRIMSDAEGIRNLVGTGLVQLRRRPRDGGPRPRRAVLAELAADRRSPCVLLGVFGGGMAIAFTRCGRCSASAARSTRRSPAGSPKRSAASASSRPTPPRSARSSSSRRARTGCSATSRSR